MTTAKVTSRRRRTVERLGVPGRPRRVFREDIERAARLRLDGWSWVRIGIELRNSPATIARAVRRYNADPARYPSLADAHRAARDFRWSKLPPLRLRNRAAERRAREERRRQNGAAQPTPVLPAPVDRENWSVENPFANPFVMEEIRRGPKFYAIEVRRTPRLEIVPIADAIGFRRFADPAYWATAGGGRT